MSPAVMAFSGRCGQPRSKIEDEFEDEHEFDDEEKGRVPHSKLWLTGQGFA